MIKRLTYFISLLILPSITLAQLSLSFDGLGTPGTTDGDYVYVANDASLNFTTNQSYTLSAWFKVDELPTHSSGSWVFKKKYSSNTGVYGIKIQSSGTMHV